MLVADSSFLVSLFLPSDKNHEEAKRLFAGVKDKIFISNIIFYETLTVINIKGSSGEKKTAHEKIRQNEMFVTDYLGVAELEEILQEFVGQESKISFADCSVIKIAKRSHSKVLAFDRELLKEVG